MSAAPCASDVNLGVLLADDDMVHARKRCNLEQFDTSNRSQTKHYIDNAHRKFDGPKRISVRVKILGHQKHTSTINTDKPLDEHVEDIK